MAIKATIFKASMQIADMDRSVYVDHNVTIARHPSETDERMLVRVLALALNLPSDTDNGTLEFGKGLWDVEEPELWHRDLTGRIRHWIEVGQPDEKRLMKASGRADKVSVFSYSPGTLLWWQGIATRITRARNIDVWQIEAAQSQLLASVAQRTMQLQISVQDGTIWVGDGQQSIEITPVRLNPT